MFASAPAASWQPTWALRDELAPLTPPQRMQVLLPLAAARDAAAYDTRPAAVARTGSRIVRLLTTLLAADEDEGAPIARRLQRQWVPHTPSAARLIDAALILCADHELNVSAFAARCVASAGATPYDVVLAGLSALQGVKHGGQTERAERLLREVGVPQQAYSTVAGRLRCGEDIPGFGQKLYPEGDPRGAALLAWLLTSAPAAPGAALAQATAEAAAALTGERPTIDFALAALAATLGMPSGAALAIFALGRTIGWIAHAIEEYGRDSLIRPRARYVGPQPETVTAHADHTDG